MPRTKNKPKSQNAGLLKKPCKHFLWTISLVNQFRNLKITKPRRKKNNKAFHKIQIHSDENIFLRDKKHTIRLLNKISWFRNEGFNSVFDDTQKINCKKRLELYLNYKNMAVFTDSIQKNWSLPQTKCR